MSSIGTAEGALGSCPARCEGARWVTWDDSALKQVPDSRVARFGWDPTATVSLSSLAVHINPVPSLLIFLLAVTKELTRTTQRRKSLFYSQLEATRYHGKKASGQEKECPRSGSRERDGHCYPAHTPISFSPGVQLMVWQHPSLAWVFLTQESLTDMPRGL